MNEQTRYNQNRWEALAQARISFSQPFAHLDAAAAEAWLAAETQFYQRAMPAVAGANILCLASGGGQQSAVFGLLGARVTVFDFSETQLARDQETAAQLGYRLATVQGDMRDLSLFSDEQFDIVWHPFSINFVPEAYTVIAEASQVLRPGGLYHLQFANPFWSMDETDWSGSAYPIRQPYVTGTQLQFSDLTWEFTNDQGQEQRVEGPHEYLHTLGTILNSLVTAGCRLIGFQEGPPGDPDAAPGSWEHLLTIVPPFFTLGARKIEPGAA